MTMVLERPGSRPVPVLRLGIVALVSVLLLYVAFTLYMAAQAAIAAVILALTVGFAIIFGSERTYSARFIYPGVAAVCLFVLLPIVYTLYIGFTNYSSFNLLTFHRATEVLLSRQSIDEGTEQPFAVVPDAGAYRIWLPKEGLLSDPVSVTGGPETSALAPAPEPTETLPTKEAVKLRSGLQALVLVKPDGTELRNSGLRTFAGVTPEFRVLEGDRLERVEDGLILTANHDTGFYETPEGEKVAPGWRVLIGWDNFTRVLTSEGIRAPMISIFGWTVAFAALSVICCFSVGLVLAVILQWEHLRFRALYRVLLILPYAVPGFISILVFRGLFNQNFGEINLILQAVFGIRPEWFTDATLARTMMVIVNTWLGYPYMMLLAMGFLQAVPGDHRKAAALEGASSLRVFFSITLPQILPPFVPLLISVFAFNFNNMVLVLLLTRGLPDIPGTLVPAGQTDILASFTYRMAFSDSSQQFGLAGAITLLIFLMVAALSYANFVALRRAEERRKGA